MRNFTVREHLVLAVYHRLKSKIGFMLFGLTVYSTFKTTNSSKRFYIAASGSNM